MNKRNTLGNKTIEGTTWMKQFRIVENTKDINNLATAQNQQTGLSTGLHSRKRAFILTSQLLAFDGKNTWPKPQLSISYEPLDNYKRSLHGYFYKNGTLAPLAPPIERQQGCSTGSFLPPNPLGWLKIASNYTLQQLKSDMSKSGNIFRVECLLKVEYPL